MPGLIVLVMTLIGAFLTALVVAREWERGTLEALFVTPVRADEILLGKIVPYFGLGMIGLRAVHRRRAISVRRAVARLALGAAVASMLYLLVALGIGLVSSVTKSQFVASQVALLVTFLPAMMLSGFLFDLSSMPIAVQFITYALPARYFVTLLQTLFLAGDVWGVILPNAAVLAVMAVLLMASRARRPASGSPEARHARHPASHPRADPQGAARDPQGPAEPRRPVRAADPADA